MSRKIETECVSCQLPCLGKSCPYYEVEVAYCDDCGEEAKYEIEGDDYCQDCAEKYLEECFNNLSIKDKADCLDISLSDI